MSRDLSVVGRALSAPARSVMLNLLMDGSERPATELAGAAGVGAPGASEHLAVLVDAGLVSVTRRGRQRFYRLADAAVAAALEQLGQLCPPAPVITYRQTRQARELARARLCYDHLAGRLGVALTQAMQDLAWLRSDADLTVTTRGRQALALIGIDATSSAASRRPLSRTCPDWTERRPHLGGRLGAMIASHAISSAWVARSTHGRGLTVTPAGVLAFQAHWHVPADVFLLPLAATDA